MTILLMLPFLFNSFVQKWYIPGGTNYGAGRICVGDTDRDGNHEFIFTTYGGSYTIYFYELYLPGTWEIDSVPDLNAPLLWDIGDFDIDGSHDLVIQCGSVSPFWTGLAIFESPDSFSYPTQEIWRDTVDIGTVQPICVYDIDRDSIPEILQTGGEAGSNYYIDFSIYESIGDNAYDVKYFFESPETPTSTIAFGDFDSDSVIEFVLGTIDGQYSIFESPENDSYIPLHVNIQLSTLNIKDCFSSSDADGDGKLEFVIKGFVVPTARINAFIFEAVSDNTYEIVKTFDLFGGSNDYYGGYSEAGDVDGDSILEIVLEGCQNIYIIKSAGNDSFYVWDTLPGHLSGSNVRVYDIDSNGLSEIIISGNNETRIYEYVPEGVKETALRLTPNALRSLQVFPNPFKEKTYIKYQITNNKFQTNSKSQIELKIYNTNGRLVKQFNYLTIRQHNQIVWYGKDNKGKQLPNGVYFVRLETPDYKETKKVTLLK